jgi:hypothetical protein
MGWGATSEGGSQSAALMTVDVAATDLQTCRQSYTNNPISGETQVRFVMPATGPAVHFELEFECGLGHGRTCLDMCNHVRSGLEVLTRDSNASSGPS